MHLLIIDSHAVVHRAYHSIPKLSSSGQPINAVYGFYSMLLSAIDQLKPDYLIVAADSPGPNFRNIEFIGYRSKRVVPDRDLISQFPIVEQSVADATIPHFAMGGYEADDIIATIAKRSLSKKLKKSDKKLIDKVTIISGDKDLMQLVNDKVSLFMPIKGLSQTQLITPVEVKEKLGVTPSQVVDLKAIMGDMSDCYPGVAGIGPKGAVDLLNKYQTLDNIYSHLGDISDNAKNKLTQGKDDAYLSQKLASLVYTVPIRFTLRRAKWNSKKAEKLIEVFKQFNFKSLISRLEKLDPNLKKPLVSKKPTLDPNQTSLF